MHTPNDADEESEENLTVGRPPARQLGLRGDIEVRQSLGCF